MALLETSPTCVTVTVPQLSSAVTRLISAAGTSAAHSKVRSAGQVMEEEEKKNKQEEKK